MQKKCTTWSWLNFRLDAFDPAHLCTTFVINQKRINCNFDNLLVWLKEFQFWPIYQIQLQNPAIPWWPSFDSKKVTCDDNSYQMCRPGPLNGVLIDWKRTIVQRKGIESQFSKLHIMLGLWAPCFKLKNKNEKTFSHKITCSIWM